MVPPPPPPLAELELVQAGEFAEAQERQDVRRIVALLGKAEDALERLPRSKKAQRQRTVARIVSDVDRRRLREVEVRRGLAWVRAAIDDGMTG